MTIALIRKLLRDVRVPLLVVAVLLCAYQCLWARITARIAGEVVPLLSQFGGIRLVKQLAFEGPGKLMQTLMGGESINLDHAMDVLSIGYVHPLMQAIFCIWAVGRASGAIAGEIDRGTMELLLAQPIPRYRIVLAHLMVDCLTIPLLCFSLLAGTYLGTWLVWPIKVPERVEPELLSVYPGQFGPALWNVAALIFAVSGYTMWLSAVNRFRWRTLGIAVYATFLMFLINVVGQLWDVLKPLRPFTVFYYYQPQQIILKQKWTVDFGMVWNGGQPLCSVNVMVVLLTVGIIGYGMAFWTFCRRDLPAPL